jgi:murein DD-endopeptidase MepM/ murein hydrolase activator NlpD
MLKKTFALALALVTVIFIGTVEAGIVTDRFPLFCYVDHQVDTYNQPNGQKVGYISANVDLIRVTQVRGDGWAYGDYPGRNGRVARWFRINELCADPGYSNRGTNIRDSQNIIKVFRTRNSGDTIGSVSNNEEVIVLADNGNRAQILYKLNNNTGWKMGWVPSSTVSARNTQPVVPSPIANTATLPNGWYRIQPMHDLSRSADALGPQIGNGNNIHMWTNVENALQQKFYLKNRGNGYFSLQSAYGNKLYVTADGRGPGANLYTSSWNGSDAQLFRLENAGNNSYHVFAKVGANLEFDCAGAGKGDGTNVQLWTKEENPWHKWRFTQVSVNNPTSTSNPVQSGNVRQRLLNTIFGRSGGKVSCDFDSYVETPGRHEGIDMVLYDGAEIHAITSGVVTAAGGDKYNTVAIYDSLNNKTTVYLHMSSVVGLCVNKSVNKGDVIGHQGSKGAKSSHIHLEVRDGKRSGAAKSLDDPRLDNSNPYPYLEKVL